MLITTKLKTYGKLKQRQLSSEMAHYKKYEFKSSVYLQNLSIKYTSIHSLRCVRVCVGVGGGGGVNRWNTDVSKFYEYCKKYLDVNWW